MNIWPRACALTLLTLCTGAQAQKLTPGLWEHQATMKTGSGQMEAAMAQMQAQMAAMSPEQRKQVEAAMGRQGMAATMPAGPGQPMTVKVCLTAEQAARDEIPQQDGQCRQTRSVRTGNTVKFTLECTGAQQAKGEGEFTVISPKEHKGRMRMSSMRQNREETMDMQLSARWLAADCGAVKPRP